ncbi:MAG: SPFH domain-containing protein, partial [Acidimicrobiales bacterium]
TELREILDDATDKWGVRVARVEIQRIEPPTDVMHAMHEQMKAERTRRAVVTTAEGERQAAITRAEGERQSAVLRAEGDKQQRILRAEGESEAIQRVAEAEKFRQETVAEGEAGAILSVYGAIHEGAPDTPLLTIKYLEALRAMADGRATKIVVPTELAGIAGSLTAVADLLGGNSSNGTGDDGAEPPAVPDAGASAAARAARPASSDPPVSPPPY